MDRGCGLTLQAVILAGGKGARLGDLTRVVPKPVLPIAGKPFLEYLIWNMARQGVTDIVLSVGYQADKIRNVIGDGARLGVAVRYAVEEKPLGTGGALGIARKHLDVSEPCYVLNGDTLFDVDLERLKNTVLHSHPDALVGIAVKRMADASRYGSVAVYEGVVKRFGEKYAAGPGLINGGVYFLLPEVLGALPSGPSSLEYGFFPRLIENNTVIAFEDNGFFLDIGVPADLAQAEKALPLWLRAAVK